MLQRKMQTRLDEEGLIAFAEVHAVANFENGAVAVAQAHGIGGIVSNTIMLGWSSKPDRVVSALEIMKRSALLGRSTVICRLAPRGWSPRPRRIDVWWGGLEHNGDMLLLFAHLLSLNPEWRGARISVKSIASGPNPSQWSDGRLRELLERSRIDAEPEVIEAPDDTPVQHVIHERSRDADIVLLGLREPAEAEIADYAARLQELVTGLPTVILVRAAGPFAGQLLETEGESAVR